MANAVLLVVGAWRRLSEPPAIASGLMLAIATSSSTRGRMRQRRSTRSCACLSDDFDIEHSTFQLETVDRRRVEERSHA